MYDKVEAGEEGEREKGQGRERGAEGTGREAERAPRPPGLTYWEDTPHQPQEGSPRPAE